MTMSDTKYELSALDRRVCQGLAAKKQVLGVELSIQTWKQALAQRRKDLVEAEKEVERIRRGVELRKYTLILLGADPDEVDTL